MQSASVRDTAWIPVVTDGGVETLSLEDVLLRGHTIRSLATRDDFERSATLRFLTAFAALVAREMRAHTTARRIPRGPGQPEVFAPSAAEDIARDGFTPKAVTAVLDRLDDRLWLIHPEHPFMQDERAQVATPYPAATLHPSVATTQSWFGDGGAASRLLTAAEAIAALVTAHFHALPTNGGATVEQPDGTSFAFRRQAASIGTRIGTDAQLWWVANNLTATLLMNVRPGWVSDDTSLPAFFETPSQTRPVDSLAEWTHSGFTAFLEATAGTLDDPLFASVHISGLIVDNPGDPALYKKLAKTQAARSRNSDPRRVFLTFTTAKGEPRRRQVTGLNPLNTPVQNLAKWWTVDGALQLTHGVLTPLDEFQASVDVLVTETHNPLSLVVDATGWGNIDRRALGDGVSETGVLADLAASASVDVERSLRHAASLVFPQGSSALSTAASALLTHITDTFYLLAREALDDAVAYAYRCEQVPATLRQQWWAAALAAFDDVTAPMMNVSTLPDISRARTVLTRRAGAAPKQALPSALSRAVARVSSAAGNDRHFAAQIRKGIRPETEHATRVALSSYLSGMSEAVQQGFCRGIGLGVDRATSRGGVSLARVLAAVPGAETRVALLRGLNRDAAVEIFDPLIFRAEATGKSINAYDLAYQLTYWETGDIHADQKHRTDFVLAFFKQKEHQ